MILPPTSTRLFLGVGIVVTLGTRLRIGSGKGKGCSLTFYVEWEQINGRKQMFPQCSLSVPYIYRLKNGLYKGCTLCSRLFPLVNTKRKPY
jgi:hypothetical protein